jgi:hypothetical protein
VLGNVFVDEIQNGLLFLGKHGVGFIYEHLYGSQVFGFHSSRPRRGGGPDAKKDGGLHDTF